MCSRGFVVHVPVAVGVAQADGASIVKGALGGFAQRKRSQAVLPAHGHRAIGADRFIRELRTVDWGFGAIA